MSYVMLWCYVLSYKLYKIEVIAMKPDALGSRRELNMTQPLDSVIAHPVTEARALTDIIS